MNRDISSCRANKAFRFQDLQLSSPRRQGESRLGHKGRASRCQRRGQDEDAKLHGAAIVNNESMAQRMTWEEAQTRSLLGAQGYVQEDEIGTAMGDPRRKTGTTQFDGSQIWNRSFNRYSTSSCDIDLLSQRFKRRFAARSLVDCRCDHGICCNRRLS